MNKKYIQTASVHLTEKEIDLLVLCINEMVKNHNRPFKKDEEKILDQLNKTKEKIKELERSREKYLGAKK